MNNLASLSTSSDDPQKVCNSVALVYYDIWCGGKKIFIVLCLWEVDMH